MRSGLQAVKYINRTLLAAINFFLLFLFTNCGQGSAVHDNNTDSAEYYTAEDYNRVEKFDTHTHFNMFDTTFLALAAQDNFRLITINVNPYYYPPIATQLAIASKLIKEYPGKISFATTFSMDGFGKKDWYRKTFDYLEQSFKAGAIAVKVWKNIGMDITDEKGRYVMIDNPAFDTIFNYMAKRGIPLVGHLGEPRNCWLPVDQMTVRGDKEYFASHPQYHMYLHPEKPSYEDQINARDHMLEKHPDLLFVGAHLGSLEWSVDELAKRLDRFPNMAVDMTQRISHLQLQAVTNWKKVHDFLVKYQDRLIYATDTQVDSTKTPEQRNKETHDIWYRHWLFFTTEGEMKVPKVDSSFRAMHLPRTVVDKIYRKNAQKWFPGILDPTRYAKLP